MAAYPVAFARLLLNFDPHFPWNPIQISDLWHVILVRFFFLFRLSGSVASASESGAWEPSRRPRRWCPRSGPSLGRRFSVANRRATRTFSSPNCKIRAKNLACMVLRLIHTPIPPPHHPMATDYLYTVHDSSNRMFNKNVDLRSVSYNSLFRHILNSPSY